VVEKQPKGKKNKKKQFDKSKMFNRVVRGRLDQAQIMDSEESVPQQESERPSGSYAVQDMLSVSDNMQVKSANKQASDIMNNEFSLQQDQSIEDSLSNNM